MTAEDLAYQKIIHLILEGHYKPGDFLLETELAQNLGMSRTPIGRATGRLVAEGFLRPNAEKGMLHTLSNTAGFRAGFHG